MGATGVCDRTDEVCVGATGVCDRSGVVSCDTTGVHNCTAVCSVPMDDTTVWPPDPSRECSQDVGVSACSVVSRSRLRSRSQSMLS